MTDSKKAGADNKGKNGKKDVTVKYNYGGKATKDWKSGERDTKGDTVEVKERVDKFFSERNKMKKYIATTVLVVVFLFLAGCDIIPPIPESRYVPTAEQDELWERQKAWRNIGDGTRNETFPDHRWSGPGGRLYEGYKPSRKSEYQRPH